MLVKHFFVLTECANAAMSDDALIRRENLRRLGKSPRELQQLVGNSYSYWRDLMQVPDKSFGEKTARRIEEALGLPRNWMDEPAADIPEIVAKPSIRPAEPKAPAPPLDWRTAAVMLARQCKDADQRELLIEFVREVDQVVAESAQISPVRAKFVTP